MPPANTLDIDRWTRVVGRLPMHLPTKGLIVAVAICCAHAATRTIAQQAENAGATRAEALLAAMGGRAAWSSVKFVHVEAVHDDVTIREPYTNKIWNDFSAPRLRLEAKNTQIDRRRAIAGGKGWRVRDGERSELTPAQYEDELSCWEANVYRTLHRLAVKDSGLEARAVGEHRLEIYRRDGKRLNWFVLNQRGEPMLFGTWESEAGTAFGPLASNGAIKYPKWGARPDGSWRYEIGRLTTAEAVPADVSFVEP